MMRRSVRRGLGGGLAAWAVALTCTAVLAAAPSAEELEKVKAALPDKAPVQPQKARKLLIFNACKGFVHSSIPLGTEALTLLGEKTGAYTATVSQDPNVFAPQNLAGFDAVCFLNSTGNLFDDPALKQSLLDFIAGGKGCVGIHAATDAFYDWPAYGALMGGYFNGHPWGAGDTVTLKCDEPKHPVATPLCCSPMTLQEEIYQLKEPYSRANQHVLVTLDTTKTDMTKPGVQRQDGDFAVAWVRNYGQGRVFYCSLGHNEHIYWTGPILSHYLAGIQFALGDLPADAVASAQHAKDGWIDLFNGKDTTGWFGGQWTVDDGTLVRKGKGDLWSEQRFGDFVLEVEFKLAPKANSGVFIRCGDVVEWLHTGIEMQVLDSYGKETPDKHDCGAVYDVAAPRVNAVKPAGEWNAARITAQGPKLKVELNGQTIVEINLDEWKEAGKNPDGTPNKFKYAYKDMPRVGRIGLQDHGDTVWYRNIRIKPLD